MVMWLLPCVFFGAWPLLPYWLLIDETVSQLAIVAAYASLLILLQRKLRAMRCAHCERMFLRGPLFPFSYACRSCGKLLKDLIREERESERD